MDIPKSQQTKATPKTKKLVNSFMKNNERKKQKQQLSSQNKNQSHLQSKFPNAKKTVNPKPEGYVKNLNIIAKKPQKNNENAIKGNVIGKKSDIKIIGNKFLLVGCVVFMVLTLVLAVSNYLVYSYFSFQSKNPAITVSKTVQLELKENQTQSFGVTIPRAVLPNSSIAQPVEVFALVLSDPIVVRVRANFTTGDHEVFALALQMNENWQLNEDGYYYYNQPLLTGEIKEAVVALVTPETLNLKPDGNLLHMATFVFETLTYDPPLITAVWTSANPSWVTNLANVLI